MDQRTRWRIGTVLCVAGAVFLGTAWATSPGASVLGLLSISLPIIVLLYAASYSALRGFAPEHGARDAPSGSGRGRTIGTGLVLVGFGWMLAVSSLFLSAGQWKFAITGFAIAAVFLSGSLPSPLTTPRIVVVFIGLVIASILVVL